MRRISLKRNFLFSCFTNSNDKWTKNARVCCEPNELFHKCSSGCEEEKNANEGNLPHLLPLKEGSEGNPLICTFLFIFCPIPQSERNRDKWKVSEVDWCISHSLHPTTRRTPRNARVTKICNKSGTHQIWTCASMCFADPLNYALCGAHRAMRGGSLASSEKGELNESLFQMICQSHTKFNQICDIFRLCALNEKRRSVWSFAGWQNIWNKYSFNSPLSGEVNESSLIAWWTLHAEHALKDLLSISGHIYRSDVFQMCADLWDSCIAQSSSCGWVWRLWNTPIDCALSPLLSVSLWLGIGAKNDEKKWNF